MKWSQLLCQRFLKGICMWDSLFENEASRDMEFVVGPEWDQWRFPAHQAVMCNNEVFRAMLEGPLANDEKTIVIEDVDGRAFNLLLRYMYGQKVEFRTYDQALATIYAANKYLCPELVKTCVIYLDKEINNETVIFIYRQLRLFSSTFDNLPSDKPFDLPSAPPEEDEKGNPIQPVGGQNDQSGTLMTRYCNSLMYNCLHYMDTNAEDLLTTDALEDLNQSQLYDIVTRDTLRISSELVLFDALMRWCVQQCKRSQLELTSQNYRRVLGDELIFSVRYLRLSETEFASRPMTSGLLHDADIAIILGSIQGYRSNYTSSVYLTTSVLESLARPRSEEISSPMPLSDRSRRIIARNLKLEASKKKKEKKKRNRMDDDEVPESKCLNYTFSILSILFD
ncbi:BTB/POZ domain-containing protein 2-like isoform X3 [Planococcus citri]|uniref:BTB/POZ domain-containing protein 2-like isoform X3 n=1 Tax=Planococcus citri TaxID=170843 RepID=UPI0031F83AA5